MAALSKEQLLQILEWVNQELSKMNEEQDKHPPIRGKKTAGYYCLSAPVKKWKVEYMGNHIKWCETAEEVKQFIKIIEG